MLSFCRRFMVVMLAIALTSQLVQGQLLLCEQMDMGGESMSASMPAAHDQHGSSGLTASATDEAQHPSPDASKCVLAASCTTAPAVLSIGQSLFGVRPATTVVPLLATSPHLRAAPPDLPPPRA